MFIILFFCRLRTLGRSHSWSFLRCWDPCFFGDFTPTTTVTSSSEFSSWYISTAQSGPSGLLLLMQHSHPTLAFKPLILFPPTLYLLPLHAHHRPLLLAVSLYLLLFLYILFFLLLPDFLRVLQLNAGGLQGARSNKTAILYFVSSC